MTSSDFSGTVVTIRGYYSIDPHTICEQTPRGPCRNVKYFTSPPIKTVGRSKELAVRKHQVSMRRKKTPSSKPKTRRKALLLARSKSTSKTERSKQSTHMGMIQRAQQDNRRLSVLGCVMGWIRGHEDGSSFLPKGNQAHADITIALANGPVTRKTRSSRSCQNAINTTSYLTKVAGRS